MKEQKEQISEEFAKELLKLIKDGNWRIYFEGISLEEMLNQEIYSIKDIEYNIINRILKYWKQKGYIKQSREEEIREKIEEEKTANYPINYEHFYREAVELIEILDNKEKNK